MAVVLLFPFYFELYGELLFILVKWKNFLPI